MADKKITPTYEGKRRKAGRSDSTDYQGRHQAPEPSSRHAVLAAGRSAW